MLTTLKVIIYFIAGWIFQSAPFWSIFHRRERGQNLVKNKHMEGSWYKKSMPRLKDIKSSVAELAQSLKKNKNIKKVYLFGSAADNFDKSSFRPADIDLLIKTNLHSGDLLAVDESILSNRSEYLEEEGYDLRAVAFSKELHKLSNTIIDPWAISSDKKLLHWGAIVASQFDSESIKKEAEDIALEETGLSRNKINTASVQNRQNWYNIYTGYKNDLIEDMPSGWYKSEGADLKLLINQSIEL